MGLWQDRGLHLQASACDALVSGIIFSCTANTRFLSRCGSLGTLPALAVAVTGVAWGYMRCSRCSAVSGGLKDAVRMGQGQEVGLLPELTKPLRRRAVLFSLLSCSTFTRRWGSCCPWLTPCWRGTSLPKSSSSTWAPGGRRTWISWRSERARGLQRGAALRAGTGLDFVSVFVLYSVAVSPAVSKGFLRNALFPGAGCVRRARDGEWGWGAVGRGCGADTQGPGAKAEPGLVLQGSTGRAGHCWGHLRAPRTAEPLCHMRTDPHVPAPGDGSPLLRFPSCVPPLR